MRWRLPCATWLASLLGLLCRLLLWRQPVGLQRRSLLMRLLLGLLGLLGLLPCLHRPRCRRLLARLLGMADRLLRHCTRLLAPRRRLCSQGGCLLRAHYWAEPSCCAC